MAYTSTRPSLAKVIPSTWDGGADAPAFVWGRLECFACKPDNLIELAEPSTSLKRSPVSATGLRQGAACQLAPPPMVPPWSKCMRGGEQRGVSLAGGFLTGESKWNPARTGRDFIYISINCLQNTIKPCWILLRNPRSCPGAWCSSPGSEAARAARSHGRRRGRLRGWSSVISGRFGLRTQPDPENPDDRCDDEPECPSGKDLGR